MSKLYQLIQSEYKFEYITEYVKPEGLMDKKNFSTPQIYPKIISQKHLNAFSELEKQQILDKYKRSLFILKIDNNSYEIQKNHKKEYCYIVKKSNFYFQKDTLFHLSEGKDEIFSYILCVKQEENIKWDAPLKDSILNFIYRFDKISSEEFIKCYSTFNQKVTGKLRYQNQIYEYEVNAGGWITLNSKEKSILLGSKNKKDTLSNFISVYYCDEDWN